MSRVRGRERAAAATGIVVYVEQAVGCVEIHTQYPVTNNGHQFVIIGEGVLVVGPEAGPRYPDSVRVRSIVFRNECQDLGLGLGPGAGPRHPWTVSKYIETVQTHSG